LTLRTRLRFILADTTVTPNRIVDYVNLDSAMDPTSMNPPRIDITYTNMGSHTNYYNGSSTYISPPDDRNPDYFWWTNHIAPFDQKTPTWGILNQIGLSLGNIADVNGWQNVIFQGNVGGTKPDEINFFNNQLFASSGHTNFNAPFSPTRTIYVYTAWQANDPLIHYTMGDLTYVAPRSNVSVDTASTIIPIGNFGSGLNQRYMPWGSGGAGGAGGSSDPNKYNLAVKDPGLVCSDAWDFPTNRFPNVGWLGRVHRGTPWQTVYLKAPPVDITTWKTWTGNQLWLQNYGQISTNFLGIGQVAQDAAFSLPTTDWHIVDLFTAALDDNATRGQMSINQGNLAAWSAFQPTPPQLQINQSIIQANLASWSAVLGGVNVLSNDTASSYVNVTMSPAGPFDLTAPPPLVRIIQGINNFRANPTNCPTGVFQRLGDILAVPELTIASPYVLATNLLPASRSLPIHQDEVYERIPQQILGLLKGNEQPRFVIYAYGQALKPADKSLVTTGGANFMLCTNYQITAETATRMVGIEGAPTNSHAVVESFNVLPPD
jgi:hypothetical protein